tara:strand:- start:1264 stop:1449 length:186 start_codon:yes stop_codon:yes gene_type:complete
MLVLSRKLNEAIIIGEGANKVSVTVVGVVGDRVKLGFVAEGHVKILREEIYDSNKSKTDET